MVVDYFGRGVFNKVILIFLVNFCYNYLWVVLDIFFYKEYINFVFLLMNNILECLFFFFLGDFDYGFIC